jgi:hypothetical protein
MEDRRVHARLHRGEIVRYDRAGKWFVEMPENWGRRGLPAERIPVTIEEAAERARAWRDAGGFVFAGVPGGAAFDKRVSP